MSFGRIARRTWREHILFSVLVELTYRCNLDCYFCYNDLGLRGKPLSTERYRRLLEELAEMQVLNLILSGGEPLAHPDFFEIGGRARDLGFLVRVKSNGHALRGRLAERLRDEVDPFLVEISLHGARAETHDRQTRVAGSFERLMANLAEMLDLGLRLKLNSTLTRWNEGELSEMMALADSFGVPLQIDPEVTPRDDGDTEPLSIRASREGLSGLFAAQAAAGAATPVEIGREGDALLPPAVDGSGEKHCGAGAATLAVDPFGSVYPCVQWRRPIGNLHESSIREIWRDSPALAEIRGQNAEVGRRIAALGAEGRLLAFCPGSAAQRSGDPTAVYPAAAERLALRGESKALGERALLPIVS